MFELFLSESFADELKKLETADRTRIKNKLADTLNNPLHYYEKLTGHNLFKLRVGKHRVICQINFSEKKITLLSVDLRKRVYNKL